MMTLSEFEQREAQALRAFMNAHAAEDFAAKPGTFSYQRFYRCADCGARHEEPRDAFLHDCHGRQKALFEERR